MRRALADAARAARARDGRALAAARGSARAAALGGAYAVTLDSASRGDAAATRTWLLLRDFRTATRFTRPGADATTAVDRLAKGKLAPARRPPRDRQGPARRLPGAAARAAQGRRRDGREGLRHARAPRPPRRRPATGRSSRRATARTAARPPPAPPRASSPTCGRAPRRATARASSAARAEIDTALDGFTAAPFTAEESARRAQQLLRFVALVPVEYGRGVKDGRVTLDFEVQEAIAFQTASDAAFDDLRDQLAKRDGAKHQRGRGQDRRARRRRRRGRAAQDRRHEPRLDREAERRDREGAQGGHARGLGEADRRLRLRPDRAHARPHGGRGRRRPAPPGRAGPARGLRVLRVRPRAAAEVDRPRASRPTSRA